MTSAPLHRGSKRPLQLIPSLGGIHENSLSKKDEFESVHGGLQGVAKKRRTHFIPARKSGIEKIPLITNSQEQPHGETNVFSQEAVFHEK